MKTFTSLPAAKARMLILFLLAFAFSMFVAMSSALYLSRVFAAPQFRLEGEWTARASAKHPGEIQLNFTRRSDNGSTSMNGSTYKLAELTGLGADILNAAARTDVKFSLIREAGTIICDGMFRDQMGAGFWKFEPNAGFRAEMKNRGFGPLTDEELLRATFGGLNTKYIDDLKAAGYGDLDFDKLVRAASHDITPAYVKEMRGAGYADLTMDDLIRARNHDVDAEYIKRVADMGFEKQPLDTVIRLQNHEITSEFIASMKAAGFSGLSIDELIRLKNHEVTPEFVAEIKAEGFPDLAAETAIRLKSHDVDRDFIRKAKAQGYTSVSLEQIVRLKDRGTVKE